MFGREKRFGRGAPDDTRSDDGGGVATADRPAADGANGNGNATATREPVRRRPVATGAVATDRAAHLRARDRFGGFNWGADFFGWLVAVGMGVILTAIVAAAGTAIGLTSNTSASDAGTIGIVGGALLIAIAFVAYYCGGYVAGRMSRFDGGRQGFGVWLIGLVITLLVAAAGAIFGDQYNVFQNLNLPRIPLDASQITTGGIIALAGIVVASLIGALIGGTVGRRYHRRVDRVAVADY
jgi:amino acid transporter